MLGNLCKTAGVSLLVLSLAGCTMGNMFGGSGDNSLLANTTPSAAQIANGANSTTLAIATECPAIKIRETTGTYRSYANNRKEPISLRYQAVIDQISRNCVVSNGLITVKMGASGRVMLGPQGQEGTVNVPLRFAVERDGIAVFTQRYNLSVSATNSTINEFAHTVENIAVPYVGGDDITFWVGFDS